MLVSHGLTMNNALIGVVKLSGFGIFALKSLTWFDTRKVLSRRNSEGVLVIGNDPNMGGSGRRYQKAALSRLLSFWVF